MVENDVTVLHALANGKQIVDKWDAEERKE